MSKHLFLTISDYVSYRDFFPIADHLVSLGHQVDFIIPSQELSFMKLSESRSSDMARFQEIDWYKELFGFTEEIKKLDYFNSFGWLAEDQISFSKYDLIWGYDGHRDTTWFLEVYPELKHKLAFVPNLKPNYVPYRPFRIGPFKRYLGFPHFDWFHHTINKKVHDLDNYVYYLMPRLYHPDSYLSENAAALFNTPNYEEHIDKFIIDRELETQYQFLTELTRIVVTKLGKILLIKSMIRDPWYMLESYVNESITKICFEDGIDRSKVKVTNGFVGKYYRDAWCVLDHGSSGIIHALLLNDRVCVLDFPNEYKSTMVDYFDGHVKNLSELEDCLNQDKFTPVTSCKWLKKNIKLFDGRATKRIVDFALWYLRWWRLGR
jgi:hypothetical protein